jgi:threonine synthase
MRGKHGVRVFMLSPHLKMSRFQTAQMFSLQDPNIFNIAVRGVFDDCQDMVKAVSNDLEFKAKYRIGTVNSINWARVSAQVVYYFKGYFAATRSNDEQASFTVPSGNFGNVCAGHIARMMGLPIRHLVVATNENDVLDEFFRTGIYRPRATAETLHTTSPSMDISKASNFERFIFDLTGRDAGQVRAMWGEVDRGRPFDLSGSPLFGRVASEYGFQSGSEQSRASPCDHASGASALGAGHRHAYGRWSEGRARTARTRCADDRAGNGTARKIRGNRGRGTGQRTGPSRRHGTPRIAAAALRGHGRGRCRHEGVHRAQRCVDRAS